MLLEVLESVIFLEIFPFGKWYYTELANVDILLFFVYCANMALHRRMFPLGMFTLHPESHPWVST
jgi:hypothetical protein